MHMFYFVCIHYFFLCVKNKSPFQYTQKQANQLKVCGWIRNTANRTVQGELEGEASQVAAMKKWLQTTGSPSSRIDKAVFSNEKSVADHHFSNFEIRH